ncbi:hypothetical protein Y032_0009g608 [Ancylostoma ceylanicum]|uniref:Uncharacterized protein n=1 Tax=Ancylostoma ceylanicum TaxID=53326 RepID=A0A016VII9_9BILA|nr:hypothetical protein Y032_0009g608 [Ancylostoma ceylanicum]
MPGYRSHGAKGAPAPSAAENTQIRDYQWRRVVLAGSSVKNAMDVGPPIRKVSWSHYCGNPKDVGLPMEKIEAAFSIMGNPFVRRVRRSSIAYKRLCHGFAYQCASAQQCGKHPDTVKKCCDYTGE